MELLRIAVWWHISCQSTANPTWGDIFESSKHIARTSLLPIFSERRRSSFELWALKQHSKMSPQGWSEETPPPRGVSYLLCSLIKNRVDNNQAHQQQPGPCSGYSRGGHAPLWDSPGSHALATVPLPPARQAHQTWRLLYSPQHSSWVAQDSIGQQHPGCRPPARQWPGHLDAGIHAPSPPAVLPRSHAVGQCAAQPVALGRGRGARLESQQNPPDALQASAPWNTHHATGSRWQFSADLPPGV